jgi:hypothetical protein
MTEMETTKDLEKLTKTKLVELAAGYPDIQGAHGMNKEELVEVIRAEMKKAGEEGGEPAPAKAKKAARRKKKLPGKETLKKNLKDLKEKRQAALEAKDGIQLKRIRTRYKKVNRLLRRVVSSAG